MAKSRKEPPPRPEEKTFCVTFRYVSTKRADASAYKGHVVISMPDDREWMTPNDAERHALAILEAVERQREIDAWDAKHQPDSYDGKVARGRRRLPKEHKRAVRAALSRLARRSAR